MAGAEPKMILWEQNGEWERDSKDREGKQFSCGSIPPSLYFLRISGKEGSSGEEQSFKRSLPSSSVIPFDNYFKTLFNKCNNSAIRVFQLMKNLSREKVARQIDGHYHEMVWTHLGPGTEAMYVAYRSLLLTSHTQADIDNPSQHLTLWGPHRVPESFWRQDSSQALLIKLSQHEEKAFLPFLTQTLGLSLIDGTGARLEVSKLFLKELYNILDVASHIISVANIHLCRWSMKMARGSM